MRRPPLVLGYHGIREVDPRHDPVRLFVSPDRLARQIQSLKRRGYEFLTMSDFATRLADGESLHATCALTFDDGTEDHLTELAPVLAEHGACGTVYVCPGLFGKPYPWAAPEAGVRMLTAEEVAGLDARPEVEVGSHTIEHTVLGDADEEFAHRIMVHCKERLEDLLDRPVLSFCYPRCVYSPACPAAARRAGYTSAVTCGPRGSWDPFELRRQSMHTPDGPVTFALKSRDLYYGVVDLPVSRVARSLTRPFRHRAER
jgi:peptidoglycan/xylan/chitin deacetylase (PgdA/CDA1 family)